MKTFWIAIVLFFVGIILCEAQTVTLNPTDDSYLKQGTPNQNVGNDNVLRVQFTGSNRSVLRFNQTDIVSAVGSGRLVTATLQLYVQSSSNWGSSGRTVDAQRLTANWTELGVTWNCGIDTNTGNPLPDCNPQWNGGTFDPEATSSVLHTNGMSGWIQYDVTTDVNAFLSGTANYGWIIKKTDESQTGSVDYTSRQGTANQRPQLVLLVESASNDTVPPQLNITSPDDAIIINDPTPQVAVSYSDGGSGVNTSTLHVHVDTTEITSTCNVTSSSATCESQTLSAGNHSVTVQISDNAGNQATDTFTFELLLGAGPLTVPVAASADTYLKFGVPNQNFGNETILRVRSAGANRSLIKMSQTEIANLIGTGTLISAQLKLYIEHNSNNWGTSGRNVDVHRLTADWTELGATWNCANDTNTGNILPDCLPLWLGGTFASQPTASVLHTNGMSGWISFDVTNDVSAFLSGGTNYGWIVKRAEELLSGQVEYASREGTPGQRPELILVVQLPDTFPPEISITGVTNGEFRNTDATITIDISDPSGVAAQTITLDGNPFTSGSTVSAEGSHTLSVYARDTIGNETTIQLSFTIDKTPPVISITGVDEGQVTNSDVTISFSATDTNLDSVTATLSKDGGTPIPFSSGTTVSNSGVYILSVQASDLAGNIATVERNFEIDKDGPVISITHPPNGSFVNTSSIEATGTVIDSNAIATSTFNGEPIELNGNAFSKNFLISNQGETTITVSATDEFGNMSTESSTFTLDTIAPIISDITPASGSELNSLTATISGSVHDDFEVAAVLLDGINATLNGDNFSGEVAFADQGERSVVATAIDLAGNSSSQTLQYTVITGLHPPEINSLPAAINSNPITISGTTDSGLSIRITGGAAEQTASTNPDGSFSINYLLNQNQINILKITAFDANDESIPKVLQILHDNIAPQQPVLLNYREVVADSPVALLGLTDPASNVTLQGLQSSITAIAAPGDGMFALQFELSDGEEKNLTLYSTDAAGNSSTSLEFSVRNDPTMEQIYDIRVSEPRNWIAVAGTIFPHPLEIILSGHEGQAVQGYPIQFEVILGGGFIDGEAIVTKLTDSLGHASVTFQLGSEIGNRHIVRATFAGNIEHPAIFEITGLEPNPGLPAKVEGVVLDENYRAIPGASIILMNTGQANLETTTDERGEFSFEDVEPGRYHLRADGSTTTLPSQRYPVLQYEIDVFEGQVNTIGMPIFLPRTQVENKLDVDGVTSQMYTTPAIPALTIDITPGSIMYPDGSHDGEFIVSPVPISVLPMPLPNGWATSLAISIQPAGTVFNPPLPITFPNVDKLPPGSKAIIVSFDHGQGRYVPVGEATVSDDGTVIASDPGHGVIAGAWHAMVPPNKPPCTDVKYGAQGSGGETGTQTTCARGKCNSGDLPTPDPIIACVVLAAGPPPTISANSTGKSCKIKIDKVIPEPSGSQPSITATPSMPNLQISALPSNLNVYDWNLKIIDNRATLTCVKECSKPSGAATWKPFEGNDCQGTLILGGITSVTVSACLTKDIRGFFTYGTDPGPNTIRSRIGSDETGKKIACKESDVRQFVDGIPFQGGGNDVGVFQITPLSGLRCIDIWDWTANVDHGLEILNGKRGEAAIHHVGERQRINDSRANANPPLPPCPANIPPVLGTEPDPNEGGISQREREAIRRYNGGREHRWLITNDETCEGNWIIDPVTLPENLGYVDDVLTKVCS